MLVHQRELAHIDFDRRIDGLKLGKRFLQNSEQTAVAMKPTSMRPTSPRCARCAMILACSTWRSRCCARSKNRSQTPTKALPAYMRACLMSSVQPPIAPHHWQVVARARRWQLAWRRLTIR